MKGRKNIMDKLKKFLNKHYTKVLISLIVITMVSGVLAVSIGFINKAENNPEYTISPQKTVRPKKTQKPQVLEDSLQIQENEEIKEDEEILFDEEILTEDTKRQGDEKNKKADTVRIESKNTCTISVNCSEALNNISDLDVEMERIIPKDGWMLKATKVEFEEGETVFDVLSRVLKEEKIHFEFMKTPAYDSAYIEGIGNLYEFDCGPASGWQYKVNGETPMVGCSQYVLEDGDKVEYIYTCDYGANL